MAPPVSPATTSTDVGDVGLDGDGRRPIARARASRSASAAVPATMIRAAPAARAAHVQARPCWPGPWMSTVSPKVTPAVQDGPLVAVGHHRPAQHCSLVAHAVAHLEQLGVGIDVEVVGQSAEQVRRVGGGGGGAAVEGALRAEAGSAVAAVPAMAAAPRALEDHPVALGHPVDGGRRPPQPLDPAEDLVAEDHRVGHVDAAVEVLHVGAAHAAQPDAEQRPVVGHLRHRVLPDLQALRPQQRRRSSSVHSSPLIHAQPTDLGQRTRSPVLERGLAQ